MNQVSFGSHDFANITSGRKNCDGSLFMQNVARKSEKRFLNKKEKPMYVGCRYRFRQIFFWIEPFISWQKATLQCPILYEPRCKGFFSISIQIYEMKKKIYKTFSNLNTKIRRNLPGSNKIDRQIYESNIRNLNSCGLLLCLSCGFWWMIHGRIALTMMSPSSLLFGE